MKILFRQYLKFTQAVLAMFMVTHLVAEPMPLASHKEIVIFREMMKQEINTKKVELDTDLDVVGALAVVEDDFDNHRIDPITFSRYALGMMIGNGYPDGVTTGLKTKPNEEKVIKQIIQKAAVHGRNLQFSADQIWSARPRQDAVQKHAHILSDLSRVGQVDHSFEYESHKFQEYDTDQILKEICASFASTPAAELMDCAQVDLKDKVTKSFILTFPLLSEFEQSEIVEVFNKSKASDDFGKDVEQALTYVSTSCNSRKSASDFVKNSVLESIQPLIDAIPAGYITKLDHTGSTLEQRNAIRAFVEEVNKLTPQRKEICLNALFRKLNFPAAAHAITPPIQALIEAIPLKPEIEGNNTQLAIRKALMPGNSSSMNNVPLQTCLTAIAALPDVHRDIHYRALIDKVRTMIPTIPANPGESGAEFNVRKQRLIGSFKTAQVKLINDLIGTRIAAITPPRELISPDHVVLPIDAEDYVTEVRNFAVIQAIVGQPAEDSKNAGFENRLINFLVAHWTTNYKPEGVGVDFTLVRQELQDRFGDINGLEHSFVTRRILKVQLVETILHNLTVRPDAHTFVALLACIPIVEDELLALLFNPSHVYTRMEKIREFSSIDYNDPYKIEQLSEEGFIPK